MLIALDGVLAGVACSGAAHADEASKPDHGDGGSLRGHHRGPSSGESL